MIVNGKDSTLKFQQKNWSFLQCHLWISLTLTVILNNSEEFYFAEKYKFFLIAKADGNGISQKLLTYSYSEFQSEKHLPSLCEMTGWNATSKSLDPIVDSLSDWPVLFIYLLYKGRIFFFILKPRIYFQSHLIYKKGDINCPWSSSVDISGSLFVHTIITKTLLEFY